MCTINVNANLCCKMTYSLFPVVLKADVCTSRQLHITSQFDVVVFMRHDCSERQFIICAKVFVDPQSHQENSQIAYSSCFTICVVNVLLHTMSRLLQIFVK